MSAVEELRDDASSRKKFLRMMGGTGAASALAVLVAACGSDSDDKSSSGTKDTATTSTNEQDAGTNKGDIDILNYALTLEYLEAEFYKEAVAHGGLKGNVLSLAKVLGDTEQQHVEAITATVKQLGGKPVAKPKTAFGPVIKAGPDKILATAAMVENLGAAAYLAQAPRIKSKAVLGAALAIHSVEARHAAALNKLIGKGFTGSGPLVGSIPDGPFAKPMEMNEVLKAVTPFIAS